ncbi:MAG: HAD-IA family hydrolase [Patescibacteria group bacterium]|jgi:2-haloacid dehalogenase
MTKKSKEIFELTLERLGVKSEEAVFIDDREDNLVVARELGIKTVLFTSVIDLEEKMALI